MPHWVSILNNPLPDNSTANAGNVFFEPITVKSSSSLFPHMCAVFNDTTTRLLLTDTFAVPTNYSTGAAIIVLWDTTAASTAAVLWEFDYRALGTSEATNSTSVQESTGANTQAASSAGLILTQTSFGLTATNFSTGDLVQFSLARDGSSTGVDTLAAAARVLDVLFEWSTG